MFHFNTCIAGIIHDLYCTVVITISVLCRCCCCLNLFILQTIFVSFNYGFENCVLGFDLHKFSETLPRQKLQHTYIVFKYYKHLYLFVNKGHFKTAEGMVSAVSLNSIQEGQLSVQ